MGLFLILHRGTGKFFGLVISFFRSFISFLRTFISPLRGENSFSTELFGYSSLDMPHASAPIKLYPQNPLDKHFNLYTSTLSGIVRSVKAD